MATTLSAQIVSRKTKGINCTLLARRKEALWPPVGVQKRSALAAELYSGPVSGNWALLRQDHDRRTLVGPIIEINDILVHEPDAAE